MQPTPVHVAVMDSRKPGALVTLPVERLSPGARAWRGARRMLLVSGIGLVILPVPLMHACGAIIALVAGPIAGFFAWRSTAVLGRGEVPCPKCAVTLAVPEGLAGWPARLHCQACGAMAELRPDGPPAA